MINEDIYVKKIELCILKITFSEILGHNTDNSVNHLLKNCFGGAALHINMGHQCFFKIFPYHSSY